MADDRVIPIGERLGSERLYDEYAPPPAEAMMPDPVPMPKPKRRQKAAKPLPQVGQERPPAAKTADAKWREITGNCLELTGITAITAGSWLIAAWLGLIVLGVCLILLGAAISIQRSP